MESSKGLPDLPMPYKEREGGIPMEKKKSLLPKLFWSTLYLSAFTFGGGYVIVTLMKEKFVDRYHWIEEDEMLDLVAIAQSSPGAIAVNGAIVVGYKLAGTESSTTSFAQGGLQSRLHDRILQIEDEVLLDTLYVAPCDPQTLEWRDASILVRVVADRSPDNFSSFIEEGKQWDIPVPITKNGISVSSLSPGKGYVITIEFSLNSFQIQAEEEDWEEHVLIDIPIVDHG